MQRQTIINTLTVSSIKTTARECPRNILVGEKKQDKLKKKKLAETLRKAFGQKSHNVKSLKCWLHSDSTEWIKKKSTHSKLTAAHSASCVTKLACMLHSWYVDYCLHSVAAKIQFKAIYGCVVVVHNIHH